MTRYTAQDLERKFRGIASIRISQKKAGKSEYANDAGYWDGGHCNWNGSHNLSEDCETLSKFFTDITELRNVRKELINFNNQQEFDKNKQNLLEKVNQFITGLQMKTSNNTSIGGVCIIWADFAHFFGSILDEFRKELEMLKTDIERIPYNEIKELKKLESDERKIQKEIEENERKARNETDPDKKKKFLFFANEAKDKWKKILSRKKELKSSHLGDNFDPDSHIDNFLKVVEDKLAGKSRPKPTAPNRTDKTQSSTTPNDSANTNSSSSTPQNNSSPTENKQDQKSFFQKYWKEMLLISAFLVGCYYIYNQPEE